MITRETLYQFVRILNKIRGNEIHAILKHQLSFTAERTTHDCN